MLLPKAVGSTIIVLPDQNTKVEVGGHWYEIDPKTKLLLGAESPGTTGVVVSVGEHVEEPDFVRVREQLTAARATGGRVDSVRVLWIRDLSLSTTVDGVTYVVLKVPTRAEMGECRVCQRAKYRGRDEVQAILDGAVSFEVVREDGAATGGNGA